MIEFLKVSQNALLPFDNPFRLKERTRETHIISKLLPIKLPKETTGTSPKLSHTLILVHIPVVKYVVKILCVRSWKQSMAKLKSEQTEDSIGNKEYRWKSSVGESDETQRWREIVARAGG